MYKISEYGFTLVNDVNMPLTQNNEIASRIRQICQYAQTHIAPITHNKNIVLFSRYKINLFGTVFVNEDNVIFGVYNAQEKTILQSINLSVFCPKDYWAEDFLAKSKSIYEKLLRKEVVSEPPHELVSAWEEVVFSRHADFTFP